MIALLVALELLAATPRYRATPLLEGLEPPARPTAPAWFSGRVLTRPGLHVGVRGHLLARGDELAAAVTAQVTVGALP